MVIQFKILKLWDHHNRGAFIAARPLSYQDPLVIKEGSLLQGIPILHYTEDYPISKEETLQNNIYIFRPTALTGYPKGHFQEGQVVELIV